MQTASILTHLVTFMSSYAWRWQLGPLLWLRADGTYSGALAGTGRRFDDEARAFQVAAWKLLVAALDQRDENADVMVARHGGGWAHLSRTRCTVGRWHILAHTGDVTRGQLLPAEADPLVALDALGADTRLLKNRLAALAIKVGAPDIDLPEETVVRAA